MVATLAGRLRLGRKGRSVANGVRKGKQIVRPWLLRGGRHRQPQHFPAAGNCQRISMLFAEVIAVGFRVSGQRAQDCGGVRIHVRQRSYRRLAAGRP
jgi:hypothetical protein